MKLIEKSVQEQIKKSITKSSNSNGNELACIIMASGLSKRFGNNKLITDLLGKPMISWILEATEDLFSQRIVVTRHPEIENLCHEKNIPVIIHNLPHRNDTIRLGIESLDQNIKGCMFCPGDQPLLSSKTIQTMIETALKNTKSILRASYGNTIGAPVLFPQWAFTELKKLPKGKGGNIILKNNADKILLIPVRHKYELLDIDTQEDLKQIMKYLK